MLRRMVVLAVLALGSSTLLPAASMQEDGKTAVLERIDVAQGICVLVGDRRCELALQLARASNLTIYVQLSDPADVAAACRAADAAGLYGSRIFVEKGTPAHLGLANDLADAVVVLGEAAPPAKAEVLRVLRPEGKAIVGGEVWTKPLPPGTDDWSHHYRRPDNNPQSQDRLARAPYLTQFVVEPRYAPAPQAAVAAGGRVFMAFGHVAWHQREEAMLNTLLAVNGFNGTLLWKRLLTPGIMVDRSTMVATPTTLYLADEKSCKLLDAATGKLQDEIVAPAELTGGSFWKWMALDDGLLFALVGPDEKQDPDARWRSIRHGWPWTGISSGYNDPKYAWGFAKTLVAMDPKTKKVVWSHQEDPPIDSRSLCMAGGRIYFCSFGHYVACLDAKTGRMIWKRTADKDRQVFEAIGPYRPGHGYVGGWKSTVYLKCTDKAIYFVGPQVEWLTALSTQDGRVLWRHPAKDLHIMIRDDGLYTIGPQNSAGDTKKLDPLTGKVLENYDTRRRACTRATGTCDGIFFRGHEGSGRFDIAAGKTAWLSPVRPSCHVGVVVAHGHLYWLPWVCDCDLQMFGLFACSPAGGFVFDQKAVDAERLEKGEISAAASTQEVSPLDWPTYRADSARSARSRASIGENVRLLWQSSLKAASGPTAPVAAAGRVYLAGSDGIVRALNADTGQEQWRAYTGGSVRFPPTIAHGLALVGSDDGWAYALDAADGRLVWRFRAAPAERKIRVYEALLSTWPVASGILVDGAKAYLAAGRNDFDGTHVFCLDVAKGKILWQNNSAGHLDPFSKRGVACQGELLLHGGKLYLAGGNTVSPGVFDAATGACLNILPGGLGSAAIRGRELHLVGDQVRVSGQPLYSLAAFPVYDQSTRWARAVVTAANAKLECTEHRSDTGPAWRLVARSLDESRELWSQPLPSEPVRYGLAVDARGRVFVALQNGQLLAFGKR